MIKQTLTVLLCTTVLGITSYSTVFATGDLVDKAKPTQLHSKITGPVNLGNKSETINQGGGIKNGSFAFSGQNAGTSDSKVQEQDWTARQGPSTEVIQEQEVPSAPLQ